ncbi:MAG: hypothetical protein AB1305_00310 [Candidatus Hadarchaeota archaeon]
MAVSEDIHWLNDDRDGAKKAFDIIATETSVSLRKLKALHGSENWWPVKAYVRALAERGLIAEKDGTFKLTDHGREVFEGTKVVEGMRQL